jgi:hypothetical protein
LLTFSLTLLRHHQTMKQKASTMKRKLSNAGDVEKTDLVHLT